MKKGIFTNRQQKLIQLTENIDILLLGESNLDYRNELNHIRSQALKEIKKEVSQAQMLRAQQKVANDRN